MIGFAAWRTWAMAGALVAAGALAAAYRPAPSAARSGGARAAEEIPAEPPTLGGSGLGDGEFFLPRGIACDRAGNVYVVDRKARLQKFDAAGKFLLAWRMPEFSYGNPKGLSCDREGNVVVADTHYNRVVRFDPEGKKIGSFGNFGKGPGQFVWPLATAMDLRNDDIYVCDYGDDSDRVQKFDSKGNLLWSVGRTGAEAGEFRRPSGLTVDSKGNVYVADAVNHRIVKIGPEGQVLKCWGSLGDEPGQLSYPYDVSCSPEDVLYVAEFGNQRVQAFDAEGKSLGIYGGGRGSPVASPWGVNASRPGKVYVGDTGHSRVIVLKTEWILGRFPAKGGEQPPGEGGGTDGKR